MRTFGAIGRTVVVIYMCTPGIMYPKIYNHPGKMGHPENLGYSEIHKITISRKNGTSKEFRHAFEII